jgi:hypothetical protein
MKRSDDFEDRPWFLVPVLPGKDRNFERWNIALISALLFIVMGVFAMTLTPEWGNATASHSASAQKAQTTHKVGKTGLAR